MVDFAGMVSGAGEDKFSATGLTAVRSKVVDAPYVDECPLVRATATASATDGWGSRGLPLPEGRNCGKGFHRLRRLVKPLCSP